jgi:hypothetical protein
MREYILTEKEREVLKDYLENGVKGNHYYVLLHRLKKNYESLKRDFDLIDRSMKEELGL